MSIEIIDKFDILSGFAHTPSQIFAKYLDHWPSFSSGLTMADDDDDDDDIYIYIVSSKNCLRILPITGVVINI